MAEINDIWEHENKPKKKNPFRSRPIPKNKIQWAIDNTLSIRSASKFLGVSYNTFKKYSKMYTDDEGIPLFDKHKNPSGIGVTLKGNTGWGVKIQDIFDGKHPNYPHYKLQDRLVRDGYLKQECSNCGYDDYRDTDMRGPYLIDFLDGDSTNHTIDNLRLLCYNCFFIVKPAGRMLTTPKNISSLRRKLESVWND
jgi:hypothetical protein|tara:strand:+ start:394 stop:978 length:585 start_codon:yes stop_codon:yes gene_type:complete